MEPQAPPAPETPSISSEQIPPSIARGLVAAQQAAHPVGKADTGPHGYKYASSEDVLTETRKALANGGLALFPVDANHNPIIEWAMDGTVGEMHLDYILTSADDGAAIHIHSATPIVVEKGRPPDKAVATAKTYDLAYTLRSLLLLPRVEQGAEVDQRDDTNWQPAPPRPPAPTPQAAPPPQYERPPRQPRQPRQPREPRMAPAFDLAPPHALPSIAKPWPPETLKSVHDRMTTLAIDGKDLVAYLVTEHGARECSRISETLNTIPAARAPAIEEWMIATAQARAAEELGITPDPGASKLISMPAGPDAGDAQDEIPM